MSLGGAVAGAAAAAAIDVFKGLVERWLAEGKDPHAEATKLVSSYEAKADIDAELLAEARNVPPTNTGT